MEAHGPPPPPEEPGDGSLPPTEPPRCPHCGAEHELDQEYCLECGQRLHPLALPGLAVVRRELWSRDSPAWLWATLLALLLVALAAGAIAAVAATRDDDGGRNAGRPVVTTGPGTTETVGTITDTTPLTVPTTLPTGTIETILPTGTTVTIPSLTTTTSPTTTTTSSGSIQAWPAGKDGYTIVLSSTETSRGREPAERRARDAIDEGLPEVGILNSSDYLTLNPGYYVVFTGVYDTLGEARSRLATAKSFEPVAYVREITP